jgi:hypothetical protein
MPTASHAAMFIVMLQLLPLLLPLLLPQWQ